MSKNGTGRRDAAARMGHNEVEQYLFDYHYGRLAPALMAAVEDHVRGCKKCREDGLRHIATERQHAMQQRAKPKRRPLRPTILLLLLLLAMGLGTGGYSLYTSAKAGSLHNFFTRKAPATAANPITPTAVSPTASPATLKHGASIGGKGVVTIAWSPDGKLLALGTNPATLGGTDQGGVAIYSNGVLTVHLAGFEGHQAPGTISWSADGKQLAATGHTAIFVWNATSGARLSIIPIPAAPTSDLSIFDTKSGAAVSSIHPTLFIASGFVQWAAGGKISAAPASGVPATHLPPIGSPLIALWGSQGGNRIFHDAHNAVLFGCSDDDLAAHAAYMRWSPDSRYLLWGYPRVPVSSTVLGAPATNTTATPSATNTIPSTNTPTASALEMPNAAFAALVDRVSQGTATTTLIAWFSADGAAVAVFDGAAIAHSIEIHDAAIGTLTASITLSDVPPAPAPLNLASWQGSAPATVSVTTVQTPTMTYTTST